MLMGVGYSLMKEARDKSAKERVDIQTAVDKLVAEVKVLQLHIVYYRCDS